MPFLFSMVMTYMTFNRCETHFKNTYADFLVMILFNAVMSFVYSWIYGSYLVL